MTVSQLNEYVRRSLAADPMLRAIRLRGEVSNFKRHSSGHLYFSLKDATSRIACVMFRSAAESLRSTLRDGQQITAIGSASLYAATGQYQFYVDQIREEGIGDLYAAFEALKARLQAEGLFDASLKKPLPLLPHGVGIATSPTGAVVHDIEQVARRRHPGIRLFLRPTIVQGDGAAADIVRAIATLDRHPDVDVIIIGRGGGSLEELWPFSEEAVARAIHAAKKPVISAVGHETDFSIADFVADVRAATPSVAAELAVPNRAALVQTLDMHRYRLGRAAVSRIMLLSRRLDELLARLSARTPSQRIREQRARVDALLSLLTAPVHAALQRKRGRLEMLDMRATRAIAAMVQNRQLRLAAALSRLEALSPRQVLARGYAIVTDAEGALITIADTQKAGNALTVRLRQGRLGVQVTEVEYGSQENEQA